jgi:hypothetical protein
VGGSWRSALSGVGGTILILSKLLGLSNFHYSATLKVMFTLPVDIYCICSLYNVAHALLLTTLTSTTRLYRRHLMMNCNWCRTEFIRVFEFQRYFSAYASLPVEWMDGWSAAWRRKSCLRFFMPSVNRMIRSWTSPCFTTHPHTTLTLSAPLQLLQCSSGAQPSR